jgi:hypothetical protein
MHIGLWWQIKKERYVLVGRVREDNSKMELREPGWGVIEIIQLEQDRDQ